MKKQFASCLGMVALLALSAPFALAQGNEQKPKEKAAKQGDSMAKGQVIAIDPKTHEARQPNAQEMESLGKAHQERRASLRGERAERKGMQAIHHHTGAEGMTLDESFMTSMVATVGKDGKLSYKCVEGEKSRPAAGVTARKDGGADVQ